MHSPIRPFTHPPIYPFIHLTSIHPSTILPPSFHHPSTILPPILPSVLLYIHPSISHHRMKIRDQKKNTNLLLFHQSLIDVSCSLLFRYLPLPSLSVQVPSPLHRVCTIAPPPPNSYSSSIRHNFYLFGPE